MLYISYTDPMSIDSYPYTAPEAQMRKLADFAFMIRDYKFAHTIYDTVRRDYATDKAFKYHAGTQVKKEERILKNR